MDTSPNAVSDLIRRATTRRLATDPADLQLFQPRDLEGVRRTPRGTVDWRPDPPEPVVYPSAPPPRLGRWRWKLVLLSLLAVAGGVAVWNNYQVATQPAISPLLPLPPKPVVAAPAPVPQAPPAPEAAPAADVPPIAVSPAETDPPAAIDPVPPEKPTVSKVTKVKKRAHATRHAVKPAAKHAPAAPSTPAAEPAPAPTKSVGRTRPAAQANDSENPL
jgi:cytoskeletal protein RodZ